MTESILPASRTARASRFARPVAALALLTAGLLASTPPRLAAATPTRPAYQLLRFDENWDLMREAPKVDFFDPVKCMVFGPEDVSWLSLGGQVRARQEVWRNFSFGTPAVADDTFGLERVQLHADLHLGTHFRLFVEGIDARTVGDRSLPGGPRIADVNSADLLNAFIDLSGRLAGGRATLRAGRQQFAFGKQRLVSPLPWLNTYRHWDGFTGFYETPQFKATVFYSWYVPVQKYRFDRRDTQEEFAGAYLTFAKNTDVYLLVRDRQARDDRRETLGVRHGRKLASGWDFDAEAAAQLGSVRGAKVRAFMFGGETGYTFKQAPGTPRLAAAFDFGSGDGNATDGTVRTFDQLYPLGHAYLGYIDIVGRQNVLDASFSIEAKPHGKVRLQLSQHFLRRASAHDALYDAGGGLVRAGNRGSSRDLGTETDLLAAFALNVHWGFEVGLNQFFAGRFIRQSGRSEDITFAYSQFTFRF